LRIYNRPMFWLIWHFHIIGVVVYRKLQVAKNKSSRHIQSNLDPKLLQSQI
jgi:hypothetical protein